jgi:release factor glutamine methyltransferase
MTKIAELLARFRAQGADPRDVDILLADVTGRSRAWLLAHGDNAVDPSLIEPLIARRLAGEPLQYIRGRCEFFGRELFVDDRVLIPRPETEILVEAAIARAPRGGRVIDVGTGSGCIAISLAAARPDLRVFAVDVSVAALAVARKNQSTLRLATSDVFDAVRGRFDLVVANPPYIPEGDLAQLQVEVRDHEPRAALTPGPRGTEAIEQILDGAGDAMVIMEIGFGQLDGVRDLAGARGFTVHEVIDDLAGIPRVVVSSRHGRH